MAVRAPLCCSRSWHPVPCLHNMCNELSVYIDLFNVCLTPNTGFSDAGATSVTPPSVFIPRTEHSDQPQHAVSMPQCFSLKMKRKGGRKSRTLLQLRPRGTRPSVPRPHGAALLPPHSPLCFALSSLFLSSLPFNLPHFPAFSA